MTAPRVNIYGFPHKGLRNALGQLSVKVGSLNPSIENEVSNTVALGNEISTLLKLHLNAEEQFVHPPIEAKLPGSMQHNHEDHNRMEVLEDEMVEAINKLEEEANPGTITNAYNAVNIFIKEYFRHMEEEETDINTIIWENFSDEEILGWQGNILKKLTPEEFFTFFKYIIPALMPIEQQIMLGGFKENAPAEAYDATIKNLEPFVSANQFEFIKTI